LTLPATSCHEVCVEIGGNPVLLRTQDGGYRNQLANRYAGFLSDTFRANLLFDIDLAPCIHAMDDDDVEIEVEARTGIWRLRRSDFRAEWDSRAGRGYIRQTPTPYSTDSILRIVHTLLLAREGGFLLHAASCVRNGRAFLFSGVSGAGKTTISRLAPADATLLSDEISYIRCDGTDYRAFGTPFFGELARPGDNRSAPLATLFFLEKGRENKLDAVAKKEALRKLLRNILFFAKDPELVKVIFRSAWEFVQRVPVRRLTFFPDERVWSIIQ
jgi:hypothetical protein